MLLVPEREIANLMTREAAFDAVEKVFAAMALAFSIIISVNLLLAYSAVKTFPGLEVRNSYVASQSFDADRAAQQALGWSISAEVRDGALYLNILDAEGLPVARRTIVEDGVLTGWTLDLATGRKLGLPSTANAARGTSAPPSPSLTNVALTQGAKSCDELLADMGTGLLITSMIGSTINPNTGDYSRGAAGFWVEKGEITHPVNECTVAGNLKDMLRRIIPANDARTHVGRQVPSLLVEGLTIAGS